MPWALRFRKACISLNSMSSGGWRGIDDTHSNLTVNIPAVIWSTPYTLLGGRVEAILTAPEITGGVPNVGGAVWSGRDYTAMYNPGGFVGAAWNLGNGLHASAFIGGWAPADGSLNRFGFDTWTLSEKVNIAYLAGSWKVAANMTFGQPGNSHAATAFGTKSGEQAMPAYFNYDVTVSKTIGKWELGVVGLGSNDMSSEVYNSALHKQGKQSQFAAGPMVGYTFPGVITSFYVTRDVYSDNYLNVDGSKSYETRVWGRAIVPLWNPSESLK